MKWSEQQKEGSKEKGLFCISILVWILVYPGQVRCYSARDKQPNLYLEFEKLIQNRQDAKALEIGADLLGGLFAKYPENIGLDDLQKRLGVASELVKLITQEFKSRQREMLINIVGYDIPPRLSLVEKHDHEDTYLLPTAQLLYWTNLGFFSSEFNIKGMAVAEKEFLQKYYDIRMQTLIEKIIRVIAQEIIANPESSDLYPYGIVLPLLYIPENNLRWENVDYLFEMMGSTSPDVWTEFCLLKVGRPKTAIAMAKCNAKSKDKCFHLVNWCLAASDMCVENHRPDAAEKLLRIATKNISNEKQIVELRLKIAENFSKCNDSAKAAKECKQISNDFPDTSLYGRVMISYFGYLAKQSEAERVLLELDSALETSKCQRYFPQLLYLKWWALYKTNQRNLSDKIGKQLTENYQNNSCIAPVLLDQAINALPRSKLVRQLGENFPQTNSGKYAQIMLECMELNNLEEENVIEEINSEVKAENAIEKSQQNKKTSKWYAAAIVDVPIDLPEIMSFNPLILSDVCSYLRKDNSVIKLIGKVDTIELVCTRYDLDTKTGVELALTDLYELVRLCNSKFYQNYWPKGKFLTFVNTALDEILERNPDSHSAVLLKCQVISRHGDFQKAIDLLKETCRNINQKNRPVFFTELVNTASQIMSSKRLTYNEKQMVKNLIYQAGLPPDSPLAQYMEGRSLGEFEISLIYRHLTSANP